jgi:hypothetical protein
MVLSGAAAGGGVGAVCIDAAVAGNGQASRPRNIKTRRRIVTPLLLINSYSLSSTANVGEES